jgi:hypothetical protein
MPFSFLDRLRKALPYRYLIPLAAVMGLAPFRSQPHLIEKLAMLFDGTLTSPLDAFDLVLHGGPLGLLLVRLGADLLGKMRSPTPGTALPNSRRKKK